jgi:hypothetical protein
MRLDDRSFAASVDAFRRTTARTADGRATRTRVLVAAGARARRRGLLRRTVWGLAVVAMVALSGSAAWTALGRWRAEPAGQTSVQRPSRAPVHRAEVASTAVAVPYLPAPAVSSSIASASAGDDGEARAYGRAHAAHFEANDPGAALALWDHYLGRYPRGTFAPEARFNRALCLLRVGRPDEAARALRPFAAGAYGGYRQREAATLIDWTAADSRR